MAAFFGFGAAMSAAIVLALATPGGWLEPMWRLNPRARDQFAAMGPWGVVLMGVVGVACLVAAVGLLRLSRLGWLVAVALLAVSLVGDFANALLGIEPRAWLGVPIAALLLWYLTSARMRAVFRSSEPSVRTKLFLFFVSVAVAAAPVKLAAEDELLSPEFKIGFEGVGPVRIGQPLWQLLGHLDGQVTVEGVMDDCTFVYATEAQDVAFMIRGGRVARVDASTPRYQTISGAKVGDPESRIHELYGARVEVTDHAYVDGHYLTVWSDDRKSALVFESDGVKVTSFRIGPLPQALWVEGCS
jgi:hypothetical protein